MYHLSPYTYLIEGVLGQGTSVNILLRFLRLTFFIAIGKEEINCAPVEFALVNPPSGQTCTQYLQPFIDSFGGYVSVPDATSNCSYCAFRTSDELLATNFNIFYSHRWRDVGIFIAFIFFNVRPRFLPSVANTC